MKDCGCGVKPKRLGALECKRKVLRRPDSMGGGYIITDKNYVIYDTARTEAEAYRKAGCRKSIKKVNKELNPRTAVRKKRYSRYEEDARFREMARNWK